MEIKDEVKYYKDKKEAEEKIHLAYKKAEMLQKEFDEKYNEGICEVCGKLDNNIKKYPYPDIWNCRCKNLCENCLKDFENKYFLYHAKTKIIYEEYQKKENQYLEEFEKSIEKYLIPELDIEKK